jgi:Domain of unknown function (DUF4265)
MANSKVKVLLREDEYAETLWADPVGPDRYRLDNSPFWAYGLSWQDVIEAHPDENGQLACTRVIEKAGHRTVRVIFSPGMDVDSSAKAVMDVVVQLGCTYEGRHPGYLAIDIPPGIDLMKVAGYLTEHQVQWEHADPRYSELYPDEPGEGDAAGPLG